MKHFIWSKFLQKIENEALLEICKRIESLRFCINFHPSKIQQPLILKFYARFILSVGISWGIVFPLWGQSSYVQQLETYRSSYLPEKVFVHTDKDIYAAGESIWLATYLVDGQTHRPSAFSKIIRVELLNPAKTIVRSIKLFAEEGRVSGVIDLPATLKQGTYELVAFTNYQLNGHPSTIFRKPITILEGIEKDQGKAILTKTVSQGYDRDFKVQFFPEGGECASGLLCKTAIMLTTQGERPVETKGRIEDTNGNTIVFLSTDSTGIAQMVYTPENNQSYRAVFEGVEGEYLLPKALEKGYHLNVISLPDRVRIFLSTNISQGLKHSTLVVHRRGLLHLAETLSFDQNQGTIELPRLDLQPGVYVATLFEPGGLPVSERLFFVAPSQKMGRINFSLSKQTYNLRDSVTLEIQAPINEHNEDSLNVTHLSLSVLPEAAGAHLSKENIQTWMFLNSDIDFPLPNLDQLWSSVPKKRDYRIDQLLMTRGWRRFKWEQLTENQPFKPTYLVERGLYLEGRMVRSIDTTKARPGKVFLSAPKTLWFAETMTNADGQFNFGPLNFYDSTEFVLQGRYKAKKKFDPNQSITLDDKAFVKFKFKEDKVNLPNFSPRGIGEERPYQIKQAIQLYDTLSQQSMITARNYDSLVVDLEVVDVKAERISPIEEERKRRTSLYGLPTVRMILDSFPDIRGTLNQNLHRIPGVQSWRGNLIIQNRPVQYFLDGIRVPKEEIFSLFVSEIEFIDVLRGPDNTIIGGIAGMGGTVLVYTRQGASLKPKIVPGVFTLVVQGYQKARQFAVFDHQAPGNQFRPDIRTTIHWNPHLKVGVQGPATDQFTTSDQSGEYTIVAQGMRKDGKPLFGTKKILVNHK